MLQPLIPDCWQFDRVKPSDVATLVAAGEPWAGLIMQASNGLTPATSWFPDMWRAARHAAGARYGVSWMRGAYHNLETLENPIAQADLILATIDASDGWGAGDLWVGVDIEAGTGNPSVDAPNARTIVEAGVSGFADRILQRTGKRPLLYAGSYTRALGITSRMGCGLLWFPEWTGTLDQRLLVAMGWDLNSTLLWQIVGDGSNTAPPGYPHVTPIGPLDLSVMVRANLPYAQGMEWTRTHTGSQPT